MKPIGYYERSFYMFTKIRFGMKILKVNCKVIIALRSEGIHFVNFDNGRLVRLIPKFNKEDRLIGVVLKFKVDAPGDKVLSILNSKKYICDTEWHLNKASGKK